LAYEFALHNEALTPEANRQVLSKLDRILMPTFIGLFVRFPDLTLSELSLSSSPKCLQYMDKNALSYSAIWGLRKDLGLTKGQSFAWVRFQYSIYSAATFELMRAAIQASNGFYFGYLVTQPIMVQLIQRMPVAKVLGSVSDTFATVHETSPDGTPCRLFSSGESY
jgi:hypothetical protein